MKVLFIALIAMGAFNAGARLDAVLESIIAPDSSSIKDWVFFLAGLSSVIYGAVSLMMQ